MRDLIAVGLCRLAMRTVATRKCRDGFTKALMISTTVVDLHTSIECLLLNHADELRKPPGEQDPDLAELAHVYERLTGFHPLKEAASG